MATKKRALETQSGFGEILPLDSSQWEVSSFVKPDIPKQEKKEEPGNFTRGFKKSMYQVPQTIGGTLGLLGDTLGADGLRDYGMDVYENNTKKVEGLTRESDSLSSVMEGNGNFGDWLSSGAGYVGGQALTAIGTGGIGALVGRKIAERGIRHMLENQIEKEAAKIALSKAAKVGAASASFGNNLVQEAGSIYPEALLEAQKNGVDLSASDKARIIGSSLAAAGVDTLGEALIAKKFLSGGRRAITNSAGEQVSESIGRAALREVPLGMAKEAGTEGVQTAIERYGANQDMSSKEAIRDYVDSAALGALGGASGGSASSITKQKLPETGALSRAANAGIDAQNAQAPVVPMSVPSASNKFTSMDSLISAVQNDDNPSLVREIAQRQVQEQINQPESIEGVPANFAELLQQSNQRREQERIETRESWESAKEQAAIDLAEQDRIEQENRLRLPAPDMPMPDGALIDDNGTLRPQTYADAAMSQAAAAQREELGQPISYGERGGIENVTVPSVPEAPTLILHPSGKPFTTKIGAQTRLKQLGGNHTIVPYEGGFAIRNNESQSVTQVQEQQAATGVPEATAGSSQSESAVIQPGDIMHPSGKPFTVKYPAIMTQRQSGGEIIKVDGGYIVRPPKQPSLEEIIAESQSEPTYEKGKTGAETARNKLDAENPFLSFLGKYGLNIDERSDVGGERGKARLIPGHGPLFRQNGLRLDELAQMAKEAGFLSQEQIDSETDNGGVNALSEMIGQALNNEVVPKVQSEPEVNPDVEMLNEATRLGLDVTGKTPDQVYDMVKAYHDQSLSPELNEMAADTEDNLGLESDSSSVESSSQKDMDRVEGSALSQSETSDKESKKENTEIDLANLDRSDAEYDDVPFSRSPEKKSKFGFDVDELQPIVDEIAKGWKNAPKINVVQTVDDLPFDTPTDVRGAYYKKQVYLVAANLRNRAEVEAVLFHETLGHAGLNGLFGNDLAPALRSIAMKNRKIAQAAAVWRKNNTDIKGKRTDDQYHLVSIEEALADYAGTGRTINGVEKLIAAIQKGLRAIGLNSVADWMENATDAEVLTMLASARNHIEKGSEFSVFGEQQAQAFSRETTPTPEEILAMEAEEITIESIPDPIATGEEIEQALSVFVSSFQEGTTRHLSNSASVRKIKRYSQSASNDIRGDESAERSAPSKIGSFSSYETTARVEQNFYGQDQLVIDVYGHEQIEAGLDDEPALRIELQKDGDFSIYALPSSSQAYKEFVKRGWAEPATGKDKKIQYFAGEDGEFWTRLTGTKPSEIFPLLGDIHARALAWTGKPYIGLSWQRTTGASGGTDGHRAAVLFSRTKTIGDNSRIRTPEQLQAFENVGRTVQVPTLKERFNKMTENLGKKLAQGIVDQFAPIKDLSEEAYGLMRLSKGASGAFEAMLKGGQLKLSDGVYDFDDTKRGGVIDRLLAPLQGESDDFMWWIAGNRAETLSTQGKENLFTASDIKAFKSLADGQTSFDYTIQHGIQKGKTTRDRATIYNDSLKTFNEFNKNTLDMAEQSGLIDAESRKLWESEFYIPFYRVSEESDEGVRGMNIKSGVVRQQAFKKIKGGSDKLNSDLLENTLMNWAHLLDASAKNRAAKSSLEAAVKVGAATPALSADKKTVWFMDNGEKKYFSVNDPYLLTAIQGLEYAGMRNAAMDGMTKMKHIVTMSITASPFFKTKNLIRDSISAIALADINYNPVANVKEGWKLTNPKSDEYFRMLAGGGTIHFGAMLEGNESQRIRKLIDSGVDEGTILKDWDSVASKFGKLWDAYNELGNRGEMINRSSLYNQLIKKGVSHAEASLQARDMMDFSMQGSWTIIRALTQVVPFMNARIQGLYKLGKSAKEDPKRFGIVLGSVAMSSIALMLAYSDDDDWKKREDWDRDTFWWFKFGGTAFRIPKPFEIGAIGTLAERGIEYFTRDEMTGERFIKRFKTLLLDNLSMDPTPQLFKPIIDIYANKDSFTDRPIESMSMERLQSDYRFNGTTSMPARALSTAGNTISGNHFMSPVQIDHLIRGYFGWLGTAVVGTADRIVRLVNNEPSRATMDRAKWLTGGMVSDLSSAQSRYVTQMYEQAKVLDEAYGTWRMLIKTGKIEEAKEFSEANADKLHRYKGLQNVKKQATSLNEQVRVIERSNLDADEKRDKINLIQQRKDNIARRASL